MPPAARLHIGRFHAEYVVAASHPDPADLRWRLDRLVRARLPALLEHALGPWLERGGDAVVMIRELDVELAVSPHWDGEAVARGWAAQIARAIQCAVQGRHLLAGDAGDGVAWFADRTAYLARFLAGLASGDAWDRWYFREFEGLKTLPASAALRTAVCEDPARGRDALLALPPLDRHRVLDRLAPADARRVLDGLPHVGSAADSAAGWASLLDAWLALPPRSPTPDGEERLALELYLGVARAGPAFGGPRRTRALARAARLLGDGVRAAALVRALSRGDEASLRAVSPADALVVEPLRHAPRGWVAAVARPLAPSAAARPAPGASTARATPVGGIFLLAPGLASLPLEDACAAWPAAGATPAAAAVRLVLLAKALGSVRRSRVFWDPLARELAGAHASLTPRLLRAWAAGLSPAECAAFVATCWPGGARPPRGPALLHAPARRGAPVVLIDGHRGMWLLATHRGRGQRPRSAARIVAWLLSQGALSAPVVTDDATLSRALARAGCDTLSVAEALASHTPEAATLAAVLARRHRLGDELAYLGWPAGELPPPADLAFAIAAQRLLRDYAARLPGFHASSAGYLFSGFLDVGATVEVEDDRWIVQLGRPPLQYVLALSGTARACVRIPWLGGLSLALCQEGG